MANNPDFRDLFSTFNARDVRYLVIGGYAFSFHVKPRFTKDLDLWVEPSAANARRVWESLREFGAPMQELQLADLERAGTIFF